MIRQGAFLLVLALLGGCTSLRETPAPTETIGSGSPPPEAPPVIGPPIPAPEDNALRREPLPPAPPPPAGPPAPPPATPSSTLLASVDEALTAGDLDRAAALCERALRISPRDGQLWYKLATIRFQQGRYADAQGFARRALSFAGANAALARDSNDLLGRIQTALATP
jgi:hypothetical protein